MKNFFFGRQENYLSERHYPQGSFLQTSYSCTNMKQHFEEEILSLNLRFNTRLLTSCDFATQRTL
tara:strand:- start:3 stop:197 length:195 start_codon:yes stop_codon:yes gene_type:complete